MKKENLQKNNKSGGVIKNVSRKDDMTQNDNYFDDLKEHLDKFNLIREKTSRKFDSLLEKIAESRTVNFISLKEYENYKEICIRTIINHFLYNKIVLEEFSPKLSVWGPLPETKVTSDITKISEERIDNIIDSYFNIAIAISVIKLQHYNSTVGERLSKKIFSLLNKNRTYDLSLFLKAKTIYEDHKKKKPRVTQAAALIMANSELNTYPFDVLRDTNGNDTIFFSSLQVAFKREIRSLNNLFL